MGTLILHTLTEMVPAKASRSSSNLPILTSFQGSLYCSLRTKSEEKLQRILVLLCEGVLLNNSLCGGASLGGSRSLSKILDLASHRAVVTGEWYIPGHKAMGFRSPEPFAGGGFSKGMAKVEATGIVPFTGIVLLEGEEFKSISLITQIVLLKKLMHNIMW